MASAIHMPRLGWGMEEGTFGAWLKQDGEPVQAGDLIFTVEGDKATQEIEAFDSGILRIPPDGPQPGDTIAVGALLGYVVRAGEPAPFESQPAPAQAAAAAPAQSAGVTSQSSANSAPPKIAPNGGGPWGASTSKIAISPRARRVASELGVDFSELNGSGATGRIIERDIRAAAALRPAAIKVRATPIAQRLAQENGVDLAELAKQKAGDKIERSDVEAVIAARTARPQPRRSAGGSRGKRAPGPAPAG